MIMAKVIHKTPKSFTSRVEHKPFPWCSDGTPRHFRLPACCAWPFPGCRNGTGRGGCDCGLDWSWGLGISCMARTQRYPTICPSADIRPTPRFGRIRAHGGGCNGWQLSLRPHSALTNPYLTFFYKIYWIIIITNSGRNRWSVWILRGINNDFHTILL